MLVTTDLRDRLAATLSGSYTIERELGGGGMSRVFTAEERALGRRVVVKVLPPELAAEVNVERFRREIQIASRLSHPHIVPLFAAGEADGLLYYTMPLVRGESLRARLAREKELPLDQAVQIAREVAGALECAHREGVLHRDIKPENILLEDGHALVTDFGIARALATAADQSLTGTGLTLGTPAYMSPEQAAGERELDARSDVYSLACVLYEMLAGEPPFTGPTPQAVIAKRLAQPAPSIHVVRPGVPDHIEAALARALAVVPADRYPSAGQFADALLKTPEIRARPRSGRGRLGAYRRVALLAAGLAAIAAVAFHFTRTRSKGALDGNLVAVAPFDVLDPALALWREGFVDILSRNFDGAGPLRTVPPTFVIRRWRGRADPASAAALGRATGARLTVFGSLVASGRDSVHVRAAIVDATTGRAVGEVELRDASAQMDRLTDSLTVSILRELGRSRPIGAVRNSFLGSKSLPALKAFLQGQQLYRNGKHDSALTYYQRAVEMDSTFALALRGIAYSYWATANEDSIDAYRLRAGAFNHGLAPRESLLICADSQMAAFDRESDSLYWVRQRRLHATLSELTRRYPDDAEAWYETGEARYHIGIGIPRREALAAFARSIALDSSFLPAYFHPVELAAEGGVPLLLRYLRPLVARNPADTAARLLLALVEPGHPHGEAVQRFLEGVSGWRLWETALTLMYMPDSTQLALRIVRTLQSAPGRMARDSADEPGLRRGLLADMLAGSGHLHEAAAIAGRYIDRATLARADKRVGRGADYLWAELARYGAVPADTAADVFRSWLATKNPLTSSAVPWWAQVGDTLDIRRFLEIVDSTAGVARVLSEPTRQAVAKHSRDVASAYLALARRDTTEALRRFELIGIIPQVEIYSDRTMWLTKARLLESRGRYREALSLLESLWFVSSPDAVMYHLLRGRLAERLGQRDRAIEGYRYVANVWKYADPELQPYVAEARGALVRLGAERGGRISVERP